MAKYRKKPVVIDAWQTGIWPSDAPDWLVERTKLDAFEPGSIEMFPGGGASILTLEGRMTARAGDWIIKGVNGEVYPCKPDIFAATYEPADASAIQTCTEVSDE